MAVQKAQHPLFFSRIDVRCETRPKLASIDTWHSRAIHVLRYGSSKTETSIGSLILKLSSYLTRFETLEKVQSKNNFSLCLIKNISTCCFAYLKMSATEQSENCFVVASICYEMTRESVLCWFSFCNTNSSVELAWLGYSFSWESWSVGCPAYCVWVGGCTTVVDSGITGPSGKTANGRRRSSFMVCFVVRGLRCWLLTHLYIDDVGWCRQPTVATCSAPRFCT